LDPHDFGDTGFCCGCHCHCHCHYCSK
jgi:hypothetical protein